jgi:hypothetical protein
MNHVTVSGAEGSVKYGWHTAATLRAWTMAPTEAGVLTLSGTLADVNDFAVSQRPLKFAAKNVEWPIDSLQIAGATLSAVLGPPKESYHVAMPVRTP